MTTASPGGGVATLPGDVVRELVERHERELESLAADLDRARREADAAEGRIRAHPALDLLGPDEVARLVPAAVEPGSRPPKVVAVPRTTVDRRPRTSEPPVVQPGGGADGDPAHRPVGTGPADTRSAGSRLVTSHWVWKAGVALTVVALLLLKFG